MARCPPHCFSIACAQSKTCPTLPLSIRPVPCEVLFKLMEQNVRRSGLFDKERRLNAVICMFAAWLHCGVFQIPHASKLTTSELQDAGAGNQST